MDENPYKSPMTTDSPEMHEQSLSERKAPRRQLGLASWVRWALLESLPLEVSLLLLAVAAMLVLAMCSPAVHP